MRDGVRPNVVCTLPIVALWGLACLELQAGGRGANGSPQRYHGTKVMTPTAALGTYLPRSSFQRANPMHIGISHGVDPRAASAPIRTTKHRLRPGAILRTGLSFNVFWRGWESSAISLSLLGLPAPRSASHHNLGSGSLPAQRCHHPPGIRLPCCPRRQRLHPAPHRAPTLSSQQLQPAPLPACHCRSIRACVTLCGNQLVS